MQPQFKRIAQVMGVLALVLAPVAASAQQSAPQASSNHGGIGIGVKAGPLFSSLDEANVTNGFSNRTGVIGGLFLGGNRPGLIGVGVNLLYAKKGAKDPNSSDFVNLDYIEVPVYLRINAGSSSTGGVSVYGVVGPNFDFLLKANSKDGTDLKSLFNRADYGVQFGAGVEITRFIVEGRYTKGIGNIAKNKNDPTLKTKTFAIMFGVRFN